MDEVERRLDFRSRFFFGGFRFPWISDKDRHRVFGVGPLAHFRQVIIDADKGQGGTVL